MLKIKFKKTHKNSKAPTNRIGDVGWDLYVADRTWDNKCDKWCYNFGVACDIPDGYFGFVLHRSSVKDYDVQLSNCLGLIDPIYKGTIMGYMKETSPNGKIYEIGEKAAQLVILPYPLLEFEEVEELSESERNELGFGSTGK